MIDSNELQKVQGPLKDKYRSQPESALITLKAASQIGEGISCNVETGKALSEAGLHPATGGDGSLVCSGDMLLEALAACAGVTMKAVATSLDFDLQSGSIAVEGDLDFRGTLAVDKNAPVGFKKIKLEFTIQTNETADRIQSLIKLTERYCVVYQTLVKGTSVEVETNIT